MTEVHFLHYLESAPDCANERDLIKAQTRLVISIGIRMVVQIYFERCVASYQHLSGVSTLEGGYNTKASARKNELENTFDHGHDPK